METDKVFCKVTMTDGRLLEVKGAIWGNVIEVNSRLKEHPSLLQTSPQAEGYLAIINAGTYVHKKIDHKYTTHNPYLL